MKVTIDKFLVDPEKWLMRIRTNRNRLTISDRKGDRDFVVLTRREFDSLVETAHLLSTPANAKRLLESIAQDKASRSVVRKKKKNHTKKK